MQQIRSLSCSSAIFSLVIILSLTFFTLSGYAKPVFSDTTRTFAVPTLSRTPAGNVALSWTEKDKQGTVYFYWAESADNGATFGDKKLIFASPGLGSSRLMRPKLLFRKGGQPVAVFALQGSEVAKAAMNSQADAGHHHHEGAATAPSKEGNRGGRPSDLQIVYCTSTDGGTTWSIPAPVHQDKTAQLVRGFFDAIVLANGEVGVAYLNDIPGKPHERDLRFVTTTSGKFGAEKVLDPFVCDCCNISLLVDASGTLHMYYRENQDNIRDIAHLHSTDNGQTFSKAAILSPDNWKVNGCPHSGPTSAIGAGTNLVAWYSGTTDAPGIRVANQQGKRLFVVDAPTARNPYLSPAPNAAVLVWEQSQVAESGTSSVIAYRTIRSDKPAPVQFVKNARNATNATSLVSQGKLLVAYEVRNPNNRNGIEVALAEL
ncbi:hypothetical protein GCM10023187_46850 [Nibrella viscosa]|uniref:Sialidase domain-containing protein n=1 Tax=Nibrella viscosa TaxID=1084524 RepID=A0ABP8KUA5_9BACT